MGVRAWRPSRLGLPEPDCEAEPESEPEPESEAGSEPEAEADISVYGLGSVRGETRASGGGGT